ncbi:MAG: cobalamin-independent methionine synthase II family protein [Candidatus Binataceae bacterium]
MTRFYRADVLGSLLRPAHLKEARAAYLAGKMAADEFKRIEDRCVDAALAMQEATGVDVVSDGELRRSWFSGLYTDALDGLSAAKQKARISGEGAAEETKTLDAPVVTAKIRRRRSWALEDFIYARAKAKKPLKVSLPSPLMMYLNWTREDSGAVYPDPFQLFADATEILREEARELASLGCTYIQIDTPEVCVLVDPVFSKAGFDDHGISSQRMLTEGMDLINSVPTGISGVTFGLHFCRGNYKGHWFAQGGYEAISKCFKRASNYNHLLLEYDDPRSGGFEALRDVPEHMNVVLGLVSTKTDKVESAGALMSRIDEAGRFFPRERLAISTQCGFASVAEGNPISEASQEAKLRVVAEVADRVWK